jgi:GAF domain-containing protein
MATDESASTVTTTRYSELDDVTTALEALAEALSIEEDFQVVLTQVCQQVTRAVPGVDMASVTLVRGGEAETVAATDQRVLDLDADQYRAGMGPCLQAVATGQLVRVEVAEAERIWPRFAEAAEVAGVGSFLSAPLVIDAEFSGAMNCYGLAHHGFRELDGQLLELYTTAVKAALRSARRYHQARQLTVQLREALSSRSTIEQAKGILMAARGITADAAFALLIEQSQRDNIKVRDLANRLVSTIVTPQ